jgi:5,10-methylenetetrahydromethanopterin reductase
MRPTLGVLLFSHYTVAEVIEVAELAEALGYDTLWYSDVRFARECYITLAAVAGKTRKLKLGPGVTDPYSRHPAITASAVATLDEITGGRAVLGLGTGGAGFSELRLEQKLPVAAMRETVEIIRGLLRGETVMCDGKVICLAGGRLSFKPERREVPIYFATHGAQITRLAGRIADGVLIANTLKREAFDFYVRQLEDGMAKGNRSAGSIDIGLRIEACISNNDNAAFQVMRRRVASRVMSQYPHWAYLEALGIKLPHAFVDLAVQKRPELLEEAVQHMPRDIVETMVIAGDVPAAAAQLAGALGPKITSVTIRPHAVQGEGIANVLKLFINQVLPMALKIARASD